MLTNLTLGHYGRFGNQLYQIAALVGLSRKNGQPWMVPRWRNYDHSERFGSHEDIDAFSYLENELPELPTPCNISFTDKHIHWGYHEIPDIRTGNWNMVGHFQSPRYFSGSMDEVRRVLTFKYEPPQIEAVAVHMRCGDYTDGKETYHPRMTIEYYYQAFKHVPDIPVYLFSDDLDVATRIIRAATGRPFVAQSNQHYIKDFAMMKRCKHHIISNSSYSAMAATLANQSGKIVVAPRLWFGEAAGGITGKDIYEKEWIIV